MKSVKRILQSKKIYIIAGLLLAILLAWTIINSFSETTVSSTWDGVVATSFTSGTGTEDNPYVISSAGEFAYFKSLLEGVDASYYADRNYVITNNMDYGNYDLSINNSVPFKGTIDGRYNFISNATLNSSLFSSLDGATIKNLNLKQLVVNANNEMGIIANSASGTDINFLLLDGDINVLDDVNDNVLVAGLFNSDDSSSINNVIVNFNVDELVSFSSIINEGEDTTISNILVNEMYPIVSDDIELNVTNVYKFSVDNDVTVNNKDLNKFSDELYKVVLDDSTFEFNSIITKEEGTKGVIPDRSASISIHDSGIDTTNHAIYVNDLASDYNYYMGLNYTEIRNTNGTIPNGTNQNLYSNSNLATFYIRYSGEDINDASTYGTVSVSENIKDYYYYKRYPVVNGYVTFDLIDSPWANRPTGRGFNGWVTDYTGAVVSLDMETYVRSVKVPVSDVSAPISITFYSSWTTATVVTATGNLSNLKSVGMNSLGPEYGDLTIYYVTGRVNNNNRYPTSNYLYDLNGNHITSGSTCSTPGGCTYLSPNTNNTYSSNTTYYNVDTSTTPATVSVATPQRKAIPYYNNGGYAAGYFIRVTSGSDNIYSSTGEKLSSCSGTCYKLLQYSDGMLDNNTTYYYLTTRDTNIFAPNSTNTINTGNISTSRPMTITGINEGIDRSSNRTIQLNGNWTISSDLRVEFITFYVSSTTTDTTSFNGGTIYYKIIGNFKNVKLGRGLKRNGNNLTATSFVGGSSSSATSLSRYTLIVESGFYQNGSGVGFIPDQYTSVPTHRVNAEVTLGNDYDMIDNSNNNLIVYYCYSGTWASNLYNSSSSNDTFDTPAINTTIKSGSFGTNHGDYAAGVYVGGRNSGTHYALRSMTVEGGDIYNLIGGPMSSDSRASKNDIIINVKGGTINMIFGGAGVSNTVGNRILNITGGTINYSILAGSNAYDRGTNSNNPYGKIDGDTLVYVGGGVTVGTKNDSLYNISAGNVFGAGNGRAGELDVGSVNNSNVIIDEAANILGDIYGGGNFGAVGGSLTGNSSSSSSSSVSGVYEDGTADNNIRYYGANPDNYIQFNGELYRIIGLFNNVSTNDGNKNLIRIVKNTSSSSSQAWLNEYISSGNNRYYPNYFVRNDNNNTKSAIYNYLNTTYYNNINSTYRNYIQNVNWNLGAINNANNNTSSFYISERGNTAGSTYSVTSYNYNVGLFYASDFGFANNDSTCLSLNLGSYSENSSCYNNNWLSSLVTSDAWTMTPSTTYSNIYSGWSNYTYNAYNEFYLGSNHNIVSDAVVYTSGWLSVSYNYRAYAVYPSFYLKDDITISSGSGTRTDPYIIGSSDDKLTDIVYEIMHPSTPEPEPGVATHNESEYQARTHIVVLGGDIAGNIFGAGNSNGAGNSTNGNIALSKITIDIINCDIEGSVYGGSNAEGIVYGDVFINVTDGDIAGSVYGGGKGGHDNESDGTYVTDNIFVTIGNSNTSDLTIHGSVYGGSAFGTVNAANETATSSNYGTNVTVNDGVIIGSVFGGGQGDTTYTPKVLGRIDVTINGGDITSVFGGNDQAGTHTASNKVYLKGGTVGSAYGGGNRSSVTTTNVYLQGSTVTTIYGGSNALGDVTTANVTLSSGSVVNAYGGNNVGGTCATTNVSVNGTASVSSSIYGGGNQVATTTTNITLTSAGATIPNVYGGGNNAGVTTANIAKNGTTVTNLFGGSNSSGTVGNSIINHTSGTTTNLYGGNNAGGNTVTSTINISGGNIGSTYGGGNQANSGTSNINVSGGTTTNVFGGGNNAGLTTSNVHMTSGNVSNIYGGSNNSGLVTTANVLIDNSSSVVGSIYGGGNLAQVGTPYVTINNGTIGNVYGGGNLAQVNGNTTVDINGGTISQNIYGGGNYGVVKGSSSVTITDATILGSAYAGGNGAAATLEGNTHITIDGNTTIGTSSSVPPATGSVFGGGNQAYTGKEATNNSTSRVDIVSGTIYGNVYGGANTSVIYGNTIVNIGEDAVNDSNLTSGNIYIKGHVFGGGEANASGSENYDWYFISVTQGTNITVDANGHNSFRIDGSFYGGGNASSASGDSYLLIKNYGTISNPKSNISIQRVNYVTIDNSAMILKGAIDRANDYDRELFSISRVNNFKLKNNSTLFLETGANLLETFESLDSSNNKAAVTINTEQNTVSKTVDNRIYVYEGKNLNIAKDQQVTDYGTVSGMTFFGIFNYDNDRNVNTGMYSPDYDAGDLLDWTGTFTRGSYVLGKHVTNHDITVDGFYSNFMNEDTLVNEVNYIEPTPSSAQYYMWFVGENVLECNVNLVASKYSTLGSIEYSFMDFYKPNTSFQILGFDSNDIASGVTLVDKLNIPRIASSAQIANNQFGLAMEASNTGWLTTGKTSFYTSEPSINGVTYYEGENSSVVPTMLFYLYHSKNLNEEKDLGTVRISIMAITKINALSNEIRRLVVNVNMSTALFQTSEYEGAMTPGDKYELFTSTSNNITTKSKFSAYYALYAENENLYSAGYYRVLASSYVLPENTKITMIDFGTGIPEYYYHIINSSDVQAAQAEYALQGECSYALSMFTPMGSRSNSNNYDDATMNSIYYDGSDSSEEFIFIVDFSDTTITQDILGNTLLIEIRDSQDASRITVLGIQHAQLTYNLYSNCDSIIDIDATESDDPLYIGYSDIFDVSVNYQNSSISGVTVTDTQYFDSKLGLQIYILNNEDNMVSGTDLTGTYFVMDGVTYYPDINGVTHIKMSDKVGNAQKWIIFNTDNSSLATGDYTFVFEAFGSADGMYYGNNLPDKDECDITIINMSYGFKPELAADSVIFSAENDKDLIFTIYYTSLLESPNIRLALYRRKYDQIYDTNYEIVDFSDYAASDLITTDNLYEYLIITEPNASTGCTIQLNDELVTGTYRLSFRLYDDDTMIGEVLRYIIIK